MNKSDLEKMQKCQEEYNKFFENTPFQREIDKIAKDISDRHDSAMAMEFTRTIGKILAENGIFVNCKSCEYTEDISEKMFGIKYGVVFDSVDCTEHDKKFTDKITELEKECEKKQKRIKDLEKSMKLFSMLNKIEKPGLYKDFVETYINSKISIKDSEIEVLREKISKLESELSVKENMLKIKSGLREENNSDFELIFPNFKKINGKLYVSDREHCKLIDDYTELKCKYRALMMQHEELAKISGRIAERLLAYCNHNSGGGEK